MRLRGDCGVGVGQTGISCRDGLEMSASGISTNLLAAWRNHNEGSPLAHWSAPWTQELLGVLPGGRSASSRRLLGASFLQVFLTPRQRQEKVEGFVVSLYATGCYTVPEEDPDQLVPLTCLRVALSVAGLSGIAR